MAHEDDDRHWYDDDRLYSSGRDSDDSPLLSHRLYEKRHYEPYTLAKTEERDRRSTLSVLMKFFLFCTAMILFCVLLYIPVYNKANDQLSKALVAGWNTQTNRDTKLYVLPNNVTLIHQPLDICSKEDRSIKNKLFLLIVVCSATENFDRRIAIRDSWGNRTKYIELAKVSKKTRDRYKNYNYTYDLYIEPNGSRQKRSAGIAGMVPEIVEMLKNSITDSKTDVPEKRFDDDDGMLPQFDMNSVLNSYIANYDYDETNVMKIPPRGYEDTPDLRKIIKILRKTNFPKIEEDEIPENTVVDFKLVFLLGLPPYRNDSDVQDRIEEETEKYGDIIQEDFTDSYNNLTLKSIMMLKWINNNCNESVRYILKTDDDMYVNVPNLVANLRDRSKEFEAKVKEHKDPKRKEYMLIGALICGARPVQDSTNKWYSPRYMYGGRVYPRYLSGTGYALSAPAASALYTAALHTPYFHLEDIYITGICAARASPRLRPRDDPQFSFSSSPPSACTAHARVTSHHVTPRHMLEICAELLSTDIVDRCERIRLMQDCLCHVLKTLKENIEETPGLVSSTCIEHVSPVVQTTIYPPKQVNGALSLSHNLIQMTRTQTVSGVNKTDKK